MDRKQAVVFGGGALALIVGITLVARSGETPATPREAPVPSATVATAKAPAPTVPSNSGNAVAPPGLDAARPADCLIEPSQVVRVNSGVEGVVQNIYVDRGDDVRRGQVVAQLYTDVERAAAAAAQARASNPHAERAAASRAAYLATVSQRSDQVSQYLARDAVDEARANAQSAAEERKAAAEEQRVARLEYVQAQRVIGQKTVRSPVNGIVTERRMAPGEYRGADATHILTIAQVDPLNVEVFAPIAQLDAVQVGDEVSIFPEAPVGGKYRARIKVIDRVFDAASGTFGMRLALPNPGNKLPAGLRCRLEIDRKPANNAARPA
ncbi:efflux RND transporter periplasmic adaptor subunit [Sphingobium sp. AN641]|uniref:efflux RND transporter periplasmic adaptor subunit n=1 Tax=Sphingobium sp. AN641 TaxID=3133443 RepID=UPI0030C5B652